MFNDDNFFDGHNCIEILDKDLKLAPIVTNDPNNVDSGNGLITSIWGPHAWEFIHSVAFGYPISPSEEQKKNYKDFFIKMGDILPCGYCRTSFKQFITENQDTVIDDNVMKSRENLTKWTFNLHNAINNKLGHNYGETYEEMCFKYESYRAKCSKTANGCVMPISIKANSYQKSDIQRAQVIPYEICDKFRNYAVKLGLHKYSEYLYYYKKLKRNCKMWGIRDCSCRKVIKYMRKKGINAIDEKTGLPSLYEMILFSMMCSTIDIRKINEMVKKF